jgi:hypothetical protein
MICTKTILATKSVRLSGVTHCRYSRAAISYHKKKIKKSKLLGNHKAMLGTRDDPLHTHSLQAIHLKHRGRYQWPPTQNSSPRASRASGVWRLEGLRVSKQEELPMGAFARRFRQNVTMAVAAQRVAAWPAT